MRLEVGVKFNTADTDAVRTNVATALNDTH